MCINEYVCLCVCVYEFVGQLLVLSPTTLQVGQFDKPSLDQIVRGEANANGNGTLDPVHTQALVEAVFDALLPVQSKRCTNIRI